MKDTVKDLKERRSIKKYQDRQIEEEDLQEILRAGMNAPTGMGMQSPVMAVIQDKETISKLSKMNAKFLGNESIDPFYGAPTVIVVLADKNRPTYVEDGSLVMGNLMNAAASLGVASCWIHRAREVFDTPEGKELLKKWGLSDNYIGVGNCILGYAKDPLPQPKPRKENYIIRA